MTPTPEQLAAVLPRCSAGLDGGDWTDDDDRLAWATKVLPWVEEAMGLDWQLILQAVQIAADTRLVELNDYAIDECASDLQRRLGDMYTHLSEPQRRDSALHRHESDETGREVPQDHLEPSAGTQDRDPKIDAVHDACQTLDDDRRRYGPRHGDRWEVRNGTAVVVGSNDWPAPTDEPTWVISDQPSSIDLLCTVGDCCNSTRTKVTRAYGGWGGKAVCREHDPRTPDTEETK